MKLLLWFGAAILLAGFVGIVLQLRKAAADDEEAQRAWAELEKHSVPLPDRFEPSMVSGLPEPARRFFTFAIQPGARLSSVVELTMAGEISLGSKEDPKYQPMTARQVLAPPYGLVWQLDAGSGAMRVTGSDGMVADRSWTRFWLVRCIPVVRAGGDLDHLRSSFGRVVAEAAFWSPAFLVPRPGVEWSRVDDDTARVTVTHGSLTQSADVRVDAKGQPLWVSMPRWTNANPEKVWRVQPFGGEVSDFRTVSGYRVPFHVDGGNFFGTPEYFPFYRARVVEMRFR
jgi:hypothetical protein